MKCIYWNARGLANSPSRLALKHLILQNNPDFIFISEPWMNFEDYPRRWFHNLHYKLFAVNSKLNLLPNLWCLCKIGLEPTILLYDSQLVAFTIDTDNKTLAFAAIYASTNYLTRRQLWNSLSTLQSQFALPWCFIGDFNSILGAHCNAHFVYLIIL